MTEQRQKEKREREQVLFIIQNNIKYGRPQQNNITAIQIRTELPYQRIKNILTCQVLFNKMELSSGIFYPL